MAKTGKRAFWMHQAAEYMIGAAFVASGLQSPEPTVPTLMGGLIMINTACSKGPLSAFRVFGKRLHRLLDACLVLLTIAAAAQPFIAIDKGTRFIMALLAVCMGVIWLQSDFAEHVKGPSRLSRLNASAAGRPSSERAPTGSEPADSAFAMNSSARSRPDGSTADAIGRTAGRLAGKGVNLYRSRKAANAQKNKP